VAWLPGAAGEVAQHKDSHGVGRQVGEPQDGAHEPSRAALPQGPEEEEEHLQKKAEDDHAVDLPCLPQLFRRGHQAAAAAADNTKFDLIHHQSTER